MPQWRKEEKKQKSERYWIRRPPLPTDARENGESSAAAASVENPHASDFRMPGGGEKQRENTPPATVSEYEEERGAGSKRRESWIDWRWRL